LIWQPPLSWLPTLLSLRPLAGTTQFAGYLSLFSC